jgi:metal-responsive CopG/Arc/MetJ family transcriptional regulator
MKEKKPSPRPGQTAVHVFLEDDLLELVDDVRFEGRFATRSDAFKAILRAGVAAMRKPKPKRS